MPLPDSVMQGLGWAPPPVDSALPGAPPPSAVASPEDITPQPVPIPGSTPPPVNGGLPDVLPKIPTAPLGDAPKPDASQPPQIGLPSLQQSSAPPEPAPPPRDFAAPLSTKQQVAINAAAPPPAPTKPAKPPTAEQQFAAVQQQQDHATQVAQQANADQTAVNVEKAHQDLAVIQNADARYKAIEDDKKKWQDEYTKTHDIKQQQADDARKEIDSYKIDNNKFMHDLGVGKSIGVFIAMALSGIGATLSGKGGEPNPILAMLQQKMHQSVAQQMDQRDQLTKKYERAEHAQDRYDKFSADRNAQFQLRTADVDQALARELRTASAKLADPQARVNGEQQAAALEQSAAEKRQAAVVAASNYDIQKRQVAVAASSAATAAGHLALDTKKFNADEEFRKWTKDKEQQHLDLEAGKLSLQAQKAQKEKVKAEGVFNPTTGNALLTEKGKQMVAAADQIEAKARASGDQNLAAQAQQMRQEANETEAVTLADKDDRREVIKGITHAQNVINESAKVKEFLRNDPGITDREGWARLKAEYGGIVAEYIKSIGANASSREFEAITQHILTYDPSSWTDRLINKAPGAASLDGLDNMVKSGVDSMLKGRGIKDGWIPTSPMENQQVQLTGKTAGEEAEDQRPGFIGQLFKFNTGDDIVKDAENKAIGNTTSAYGLAPEDDAKVRSLVAKSKTASNAEFNNIVDSLVAPIISGERPSLASGVLNLVRDENPGLYAQMLMRMPRDAPDRKDVDQARAAIGAQAPVRIPAGAP